MKFVGSGEIRINPEPIFGAAEGGDEIIITSRGRPVALLVGVDDDLEETVRLFGRAKTRTAVSRLRRAAAREGSAGMDRAEIEAEIGVARNERAAR